MHRVQLHFGAPWPLAVPRLWLVSLLGVMIAALQWRRVARLFAPRAPLHFGGAVLVARADATACVQRMIRAVCGVRRVVLVCGDPNDEGTPANAIACYCSECDLCEVTASLEDLHKITSPCTQPTLVVIESLECLWPLGSEVLLALLQRADPNLLVVMVTRNGRVPAALRTHVTQTLLAPLADSTALESRCAAQWSAWCDTPVDKTHFRAAQRDADGSPRTLLDDALLDGACAHVCVMQHT